MPHQARRLPRLGADAYGAKRRSDSSMRAFAERPMPRRRGAAPRVRVLFIDLPPFLVVIWREKLHTFLKRRDRRFWRGKLHTFRRPADAPGFPRRERSDRSGNPGGGVAFRPVPGRPISPLVGRDDPPFRPGALLRLRPACRIKSVDSPALEPTHTAPSDAPTRPCEPSPSVDAASTRGRSPRPSSLHRPTSFPRCGFVRRRRDSPTIPPNARLSISPCDDASCTSCP